MFTSVIGSLLLVIHFGWPPVHGALEYEACVWAVGLHESPACTITVDPIAEVHIPAAWADVTAHARACDEATCGPWSEGLLLQRATTLAGDVDGDGVVSIDDFSTVREQMFRSAESVDWLVCTPVAVEP